jgi:hypothetical protein
MIMSTTVKIVFTLERLYKFPMSRDYPLQPETHCTDDVSLHTSGVCANKSLQGISMDSSSLCMPTDVSLKV